MRIPPSYSVNLILAGAVGQRQTQLSNQFWLLVNCQESAMGSSLSGREVPGPQGAKQGDLRGGLMDFRFYAPGSELVAGLLVTEYCGSGRLEPQGAD